MTSLLVVLIATIAVYSKKKDDPHYRCYMCDNEAGIGRCDTGGGKIQNKVQCQGYSCSVTSYVRHTAKGCQSSLLLLTFCSILSI